MTFIVPNIVGALMKEITLWINVHVNDWTTQRAIIASYDSRPQQRSHKVFFKIRVVAKGWLWFFFQQLEDLVEKKDKQETAAMVGAGVFVGTALAGLGLTILTGGAAAPVAVGLVSSGEYLTSGKKLLLDFQCI